ncbi:MAG: response regulator [Planctomycetes bacterium]|nr:response regulator [Planctomycetota bacterium]
MQEKLLTSGKVAKLCQVSVPTVLNWINSGFLPSYKTAGGHNRISPLGLLRFLTENSMFIPSELYGLSGVEPEELTSEGNQKKSVAIVADDEEVVRDLLHEVLTGINYVVVDVQDGLEACLQMGLLRPELLILDLLMPRMDGLQVIQTIRKQPELNNTRIIVVSGHITDDARRALEDAGIKHIMEKPISISEFVRISRFAEEQ